MKRQRDQPESLAKNALDTTQKISRGMMQSNPVLITSMVEYVFWRQSLRSQEEPLTLDEVLGSVLGLQAIWSVLDTRVDKHMIAQIMFEYVQTNIIVPLFRENDTVATFGYKIAPTHKKFLDEICFRIKPPVSRADAEIRQMYVAQITSNLFGDSD